MGRMQRRLGKVEGVARTQARRQPRWDLELLDDDELAELEVLARLSAKMDRDGGVAASARN